MQFTKPQLVFIAVVSFIGLLLLLVFLGVLPGRRNTGQGIEITVWGIDDSRTWRNVAGRFATAYPNIKVRYQAMDADTYERDLVNAMAVGRGPDVFMIENNWLLKHGEKLTPAPAKDYTIESFQKAFPGVAEQDFTAEGAIYAMPLYIDTLVLAYNRALFSQGGVVFPPRTWDELAAAAPKLVKKTNNILTQGAFAIGGTSATVPNASSLVQAILMQAGAPMINEKLSSATFANEAGRDAFAIYTRFSDPASTAYSWDEQMKPAYDAFARGEVAGVFVYFSELQDLQARNAFLDIGVSELPQLDPSNAVNVADYWGLAVSNQSSYPEEAWRFVNFITTDTNTAAAYSNLTNHSPALRSLINDTISNTTNGIFAKQALTAQSWLQLGEESVEAAFNEAIGLVLSKEQTANRAIQRAQAIITEGLRQR